MDDVLVNAGSAFQEIEGSGKVNERARFVYAKPKGANADIEIPRLETSVMGIVREVWVHNDSETHDVRLTISGQGSISGRRIHTVPPKNVTILTSTPAGGEVWFAWYTDLGN